MKRILALLLILLLLLPCTAAAEEAALLPAERAEVVPVAQDEDALMPGMTRTCYEVTVPIHLPVTLRIQQPEGDVQEIQLQPAVAQITYYMETHFDGENLCGGAHDPQHYPKVSLLGDPPYPGGPWLNPGLVPDSMTYAVQFEPVKKVQTAKFAMQHNGSLTVTLSGLVLRMTYNGIVTIDPSGYLISAEPVTREITCDFSQTFRADAPEYTGERYLPTYEEWMGVPR